MLNNPTKLIRCAFAGFPEHYVTRFGEVVAVPDPGDYEQATDRFRPRYAASVPLHTPLREPYAGRPVLKALPLAAFG